MIERYLNLFSLAFLTVVLVVFVILFAGTPIACSLGTAHANVPWAGSATLLAGSERDLDIYVTRDRQFSCHPEPQRPLLGRKAWRRRIPRIPRYAARCAGGSGGSFAAMCIAGGAAAAAQDDRAKTSRVAKLFGSSRSNYENRACGYVLLF